MTDTTHEAPEKMKTIRLTVDLTYDQEVMHGDDEEAIAWFNGILAGKDLMLGDFGELGDMIGSVKVVTQQDDLVQAAVAAALKEAAQAARLSISEREEWPPKDGDVLVDDCMAAILALIPKGAQAALDRVVAKQREKDAKVAEGYLGCEAIAAAIREGGE